jgi:hypothetical protein
MDVTTYGFGGNGGCTVTYTISSGSPAPAGVDRNQIIWDE